jgi:hypothetical protein
MEKKDPTLFRWRSLVASKHGPKSAITRHVLLTLSIHMDTNGGSCFPSTKMIAEETALSERAICAHLSIASNNGWLKKMVHGLTGKKWKRNEYQAVIPPKALTESQYQGTDRESVPNREGTDPDDIKALTEGQSSTSYNSSNTFTSDSDEIGLSKLLLDLILFRNPEFKKPNLQKWAIHISRAIRIDNRTPEKLRAVIEWCQADDFWQNNILSTYKLREQFDQIFMKMGGSSNTIKPIDFERINDN